MPKTRLYSQAQINTHIWGSDFNYASDSLIIEFDFANKVFHVSYIFLTIDGEQITLPDQDVAMPITRIGEYVELYYDTKLRTLAARSSTIFLSTNYTLATFLNDGSSTGSLVYRMSDEPVSSRNIDFKSLTRRSTLSFRSGWSAFQGHATSAVRDGNTVHLFGLVVKNGSAAASEVIATLPFGFRPDPDLIESTLIFRTASATALADRSTTLSISKDGEILNRTAITTASDMWLGLNGISFITNDPMPVEGNDV